MAKKATEGALLGKAVRGAKLMAQVVKEAYDSGNGNRALAALTLLDEFNGDVHAILDPLAHAIAPEGIVPEQNGLEARQ